MIPKIVRRCAIVLAAWLPLFAIWVLAAVSFSQDRFSSILFSSLNSMGSAGLLGIGVWHVCRRWQWPIGFTLKFYSLQIFFALTYVVVWTAAIYGLESLRTGKPLHGFWSLPVLSRQAARLDAVRARLNPHFLFNALHTLSALVKFRPAMAEGAIERLGDMLRYTLKEDGRELVEFSEEYEFTRQYLSFEELRYEDRLKVDLQIDPESFNFDIPPFSMQTLAENAVRHAISIRPEGGSIWIKCSCRDGRLTVTVRDDGPGDGSAAGQSHQFGLRSLRDRLQSAYGPAGDLRIHTGRDGFEASFVVPSAESVSGKRERPGEVV